ncbi:MAG: DUF1361 domain-containing protein [Candidatus Izemoplasmataceae bacterium]
MTNNYTKITLSFMVFVIISPFFMIFSGNFLSFMLGFNVFLALIPLWLIWYIKHLNQNDRFYKHKVIGLSVLFILFFPNTFYIITDAIHLNSASFYSFETPYAPLVYSENIYAYIMLMHIIIAMMFGCYAGVRALHELRLFLKDMKRSRLQIELIVLMIIFVTSIGIYIGRFMRYFSWEIFRPLALINDLISRINGFFVGFILLFMIAMMMLDQGYQSLARDSLSKPNLKGLNHD